MSETKALQAEDYDVLNKAFPDDKDISEFSAWIARILDEKALEGEEWYPRNKDPEFLQELYQHIEKEPLLRESDRRAWCVATAQYLSLELTVEHFFAYRKRQQELIAELKEKFIRDEDLEAFSHYLVASFSWAAVRQRLKVPKRESDVQRMIEGFNVYVFESAEERRTWCADMNEFIEVKPKIQGFFNCRADILGWTQEQTKDKIWRAKHFASNIESVRGYTENGEEADYYADLVGALEQYETFFEITQFEYKQFISCLMHQKGHDELREAFCDCFKVFP